MRRAARLVVLGLAGALLVLAALTAAIGREATLSLVFGPVEHESVRFESLDPGDRPNRYLVCPADLCAVEPDRVSPVFDLPVAALRERWMAMIAAQPRVVAGAGEPEGLQFDFVQRSKVFAFPDSVTVRFIALDETRSSLAVFSRSHYGYDDFGANRQRVEAWLAALAGGGS